MQPGRIAALRGHLGVHGESADPVSVDAAVGGQGAVPGNAQLAAVRVAGHQEVVAVGGEAIHDRWFRRVQDTEPQARVGVGRSRDQVVAVPVGVRVMYAGERDVQAVRGQPGRAGC